MLGHPRLQIGELLLRQRQSRLCAFQPLGQRRPSRLELGQPGAPLQPLCRRRTVTARNESVPTTHAAIACDEPQPGIERLSGIDLRNHDQRQPRGESLRRADMVGKPGAAIGQGRATGGHIGPGPEAPIALGLGNRRAKVIPQRGGERLFKTPVGLNLVECALASARLLGQITRQGVDLARHRVQLGAHL